MKPLTANLKLLYQYRMIWIYYPVLITGILMLLNKSFNFAPSPSKVPIPVSLELISLYGIGIGSLAINILSKPFTFCLPDHTKNIRKMLLIVWLTVTIICSVIISILSAIDKNIDYAVFIATIGLISLSYWIGVAIILPKGKYILLAYFTIIILCLTTNILTTLNPTSKNFELVFFTHPWASTLMSGILSNLIYRAINSRDNVRRLCSMSWLGNFNKSAMVNQNRYMLERKYRNRDQKFDRDTELIGNLFSKLIRPQQSLHLAHLWGQVYLTIGPFITQWKSLLLIGLFLPVFICLTSPLPTQDAFLFTWVIFILACLPASLFCSFSRFNKFFLISRREHLWRGIVVLVTAISITLGFMGISILLLNVLSAIFPNFVLDGRVFVIPSVRWIFLITPIIISPLFGGLFILVKKNTLLVISLIILIPAVIILSCYTTIALENTPFIVGLISVLLATAVTWGFHTATLYYVSMKRSLC
jgi:hypothetical protein